VSGTAGENASSVTGAGKMGGAAGGFDPAGAGDTFEQKKSKIDLALD
jgi:hypothetical protein